MSWRTLIKYPATSTLLIVGVLLQTLALSSFSSLLDRAVGSRSWLWLVGIGGVLAIGAGGVYLARERLQKRGTFILVIVPAPRQEWSDIAEKALTWARNSNFQYSYPLRASQPLPSEINESRSLSSEISESYWGDTLDECLNYMRLLLRDGIGPLVDQRRLSIAINSPVALAFELGSRWDGESIGVQGKAFEVVHLPREDGIDPNVIWRRNPASTSIRPTNTDGEVEVLTGTIVAVHITKVHEVLIESQFPCVTYVGEPGELPLGESWQQQIDELGNNLEDALRTVAAGQQVEMILAVTSAAAFVLGHRLRDHRNKMRLMHFDAPNNQYVQVVFD